jgi:putative Mg2+ transporter-C (MgtC) family protein
MRQSLLLATSIPALGGWDVLLRLCVAAGLGGVIGVEREIRDREAGIRTHMIVALGSGLFTLVSAYGFSNFVTGGKGISEDPTRIAAQIVTGIGFLGAGAIIREGLSVRGLTTAGSLWVVAAIGMAAGAGYYWAAVVSTALTIFALWPLRILAYRTIQRIKPEEDRLTIELKPGQPIQPFLAQLHDLRHFELTDEADRRVIQLELPKIDEHLVGRLADLDYVIGVRWRR